MNIHHVLFLCFFSALFGGNIAKIPIVTAAEGVTGVTTCYPSPVGNRKFFCKDGCAAEDILVKTDDVSAQTGRYSIEYKDGSSGGFLTVVITNMTKSDSGRYRCGLGKTLFPESFSDFEVRVSNEPFLDRNYGFARTYIEGEDITYQCTNTVSGRHKFLCKDECKTEEDILLETDGNRAQNGRYSIEYKKGSFFGLYVTIKQATKSDSGWYQCGYGRALSPDSCKRNPIIVIEDLSYVPGPSFLPLVVCVPLVFVLLAVFLLIFYKWKKRNTRGNANDGHMELPAIYENCDSVSKREDVYESLDPASRDENQTYSTLHCDSAN